MLLSLSLYAIKRQAGQKPGAVFFCRSPPGLLYAPWCYNNEFVFPLPGACPPVQE